ncbi:MAG: aminomethyltransferase [Xanthomonadales bacterium]|nr:aminomethyltransferase [Xanthomonadales bacterium]NIX11698.1 aminomethyltransferase [Xanthomonadales bacterium]
MLTSATAFGWYEGNQVGVKQGDRLVKLRTKQLVVAAGRFEQPIVFQNNDLPGVFLAGGVQRLINLYGIKPGERAVVVTSNGQGWAAARDLLDCGVEIALVADTRSEIPENPDIRRVREGDVPIKTGMRIQQALGSSNVRGAVLELARGAGQTITLDCDLIVVSGGYAANNALLYQSGSKIAYDAAVDDFVPQSTPPGVLGAGHAAGTRGLEVLLLEGAAAGMQAAERVGYVDGRGILPGLKERVARLKDSYRENSLADPGGQIPIEGNKAFICFCEDVVPKDVVNAAAEGFDDIQTLKRYTTISMGPSQGKICAKNTIKLLARLKQQGVAETGTTTSRPPFTPVKLGILAGRKLDPVRQTPMHHAHLEMNAAMMNTGLWKRPEYYTDPEDEILAVRQKVGIIDVSTLGKMEVRGPDAAAFLERIYTGKLAGLRAGRLRYGLMCTEEGIIFDDGVVGRLDEEYFFLTTTSGGAQSVYEWLTWWAAAWGSRAQIIDRTSSFAAVNLAGPQARNMLTNLTDIDLSNRAFPYMRMRLGELAGIPCRMMRIGFVGELGYEIHFPAEYGRDVWSLFLEAGAEYGIAPFALEAQRVLRLEKGHIILGQDTDALSDPYSAGMGWAVKLDKPDFIGKPSLILKQNRTAGERLVGFEMVDPAVVPAEGEQFVEDGRLVGRVTSARYSPILEKSIGLGWVDSDKSALGSRITLRTGGRVAEAEIAKVPFYDPEGKQLRS